MQSRSGIKNKIAVAAGRKKADLVLKNCNIVNVFTSEIIKGDIAILDGLIAAVGSYSGEREVDLEGKYVAPGFIDSHVHIESSMVMPGQFAKAVVPWGTTAIIADPHEIANVCGANGIRFIIDNLKELPLDVFVMLPSCVPAVDFEDSGAVLSAAELKELVGLSGVLGLGELMNYPAVINGDTSVIDKLRLFKNELIDGHAPRVTGKDLAAYAAAGVRTDHECSTVNEMLEKLRLGMYIQIRNGSVAKEVPELIKGITERNIDRCLFCTDDRHPHDILEHGHINSNIKIAVANGLSPIAAIKMATINACACYGLKNRGAVAPNYYADLVVIDDLQNMDILQVYKNGIKVAENGKPLFDCSGEVDSSVLDTVKIGRVTAENLKIEILSNKANVITVEKNTLITKKAVRKVSSKDGFFSYNKRDGICKIAVVERHKTSGNIGVGLIEGISLKNAAIASTISHDSHNLVVIGDNDDDMLIAINELGKGEGGITVVSEGKVLRTLPLPIGGIMSPRPLDEVNAEVKKLEDLTYSLGVDKSINAFMSMAFLALPVIPEIRLTSRGLFDVEEFKFISAGMML